MPGGEGGKGGKGGKGGQDRQRALKGLRGAFITAPARLIRKQEESGSDRGI